MATAAPMYDEPDGERNIIWAPFPGMQTKFVASGEFEVLGGGSKGPGKTECVVIIPLGQTHKARYRAYITRETGPQLREIKDRQHRIYKQLPEKPAWNGDGHGSWTWPSGAKIINESIGTPADVEKIQGQEPSAILMDEVGNVKDEKTIDLAQAEIRSPDPSIRRMWRGTANPGKAGQAWIKRRFINKCGIDGKRIIVQKIKLPDGTIARKSRRYIPGTILDNPIYANDPLYMAQLFTLPEVLRNQLLFGDWNAGYGAALPELDESVHIVPRFNPPQHWTRFGGFDWGFAHNWCFGDFIVNEDGDVWVVDTVWGRRHLTHEIADRVSSRVPVQQLRYITADLAIKQKNRTHGDSTPTFEEEFLDYGFIFTQGNTARKSGLNNLRHYTAWRGLRLDGGNADPALRFMDTPGNRRLVDQLGAMIVDEDDMEDVLKVDSDGETGEGGDDGYDMLRVAMASRPPRAIGEFFRQPVQAFSPQTLAYMVEQLYRDRPLPEPSQRGARGGSLYTLFSGY
jgi:hypothetical protein